MNGGAVAYLAHSQYGRNRNKIAYNNSEDYITGSSEGETNDDITYEYNTTQGMLASTTGNIYGVYDMVGGNSEYTATWCYVPLSFPGEEITYDIEESDRTKTAVYGICVPENEYLRVLSINATNQIGDGLKETVLVEEWSDGTGYNYKSWFNSSIEPVYPGHSTCTRDSLFSCHCVYDAGYTLRCVLC